MKTKPKHEPLPNFDAKEVAFNVEAVRAYLNTAVLHVMEGMKEQNVDHAESAILTACLELGAQVWMQTSLGANVPVQRARETAEKEFRSFLFKWSRSEAMQRSVAANKATPS